MYGEALKTMMKKKPALSISIVTKPEKDDMDDDEYIQDMLEAHRGMENDMEGEDKEDDYLAKMKKKYAKG